MAPRSALGLLFLSGLGLIVIASAAPGQPLLQPIAQPTPPAAPAANTSQLDRLLRRLGTSQFRHGSRILTLAYAPSGQLLAAGGGADPVRLWNVETGQEKFRLNEPWVHAIVFTPRGSVLATAGEFKTIRLWEVSTGKEFGKLEGHTAPIKAMAISPDGTLIASGDQDGTIILWELIMKKAIVTLKAHAGEITALAFSPDSTLLASASADRTVRVWNADTNKEIKKLDAGCCPLAVALSADARQVFSGGDDNLVRVWSVETGKQTGALKGHEASVCSLLLARDGKTLVSAAHDGTMRLWDVTGGKQQPRVIRRNTGDSDALALTKDGKFVATAGLNNTIRIFETASGKEVTGNDGPQAGLGSIALSADGKRLVTASATGVVYVWDAAAGTILRNWATRQGGETVIALSPDGKTLVTGADTLKVWDADTGAARGDLPVDEGEAVVSLRFAPDGRLLAIGTRDGNVTLWDVPGHKALHRVAYPKAPYALAFTRDGGRLAVSGTSKIMLFDTRSGKEVKQLASKSEGTPASHPDVAALAFAPDGKTLAVAGYDAVVRLLDVDTGKEVQHCEGHASVPYGLAFSADGRTLVTGSFDSTVRLWEAFSGRPIGVLTGHVGPVFGVALSPDNKTAYSASADTTVIVWDVTGQAKTATAGTPDLEAAWRDLANENPGVANPVAWRLIAHAKEAIPFLARKVYLVDVARIDKLLKDLDSDDFDERNKANTELQGHGRWLEGRLREALVNPPSLEYKRRIEQLLDKLNVPGSLSLRQEQLRMRRVMLILEQVADAEAIQLFEKLTAGAPEEMFRAEAKMSLGRMRNGKRSG
jgi:WD40 repeat protein